MRSRILAIAAIVGAIGAPIAAQAQSDTVGIVRGGGVVVDETDAIGIVPDQRPAIITLSRHAACSANAMAMAVSRPM